MGTGEWRVPPKTGHFFISYRFYPHFHQGPTLRRRRRALGLGREYRLCRGGEEILVKGEEDWIGSRNRVTPELSERPGS